MTLLKKINRVLFGKRIIHQQVISKLPAFESETQLRRFINQKTESENAELRARNLRLGSELETIKSTKTKQQEEEIKQYVVKKKQIQLKRRKQKALKLKFVGFKDKNLPTFFLKSNRAWNKLAGVYLQETDDGSLLWYPWIKEKQGKKLIDTKFNVPASSFNAFFKENIGIVSQIKGGKVDSNFDITKEGTPVLKLPSYIDDTGEKIKVMDLSEVEKKKYEDIIEGLRNHMGGFAHELEQAKLKEIDYETDMAKGEMETKLATKEREIHAAIASHLTEKQEKSTKQLSDSVSTVQDLKIQQILESRMNRQLMEAIDDMRKTLREKLPKDEGEIAETKLRRIISEVNTSLQRRAATQPKKEVKENA